MKLFLDLGVCFLLWTGLFFIFAGAIGLLRLPDIYTRMHASGKCDTLGTTLVLLALATQVGSHIEVIKLLVMWGLLWSINPVIAHLIGKTSYQRGAEQAPGTFYIDCYEAPFPSGGEVPGKEEQHA